jgi:hypothetical protein
MPHGGSRACPETVEGFNVQSSRKTNRLEARGSSKKMRDVQVGQPLTNYCGPFQWFDQLTMSEFLKRYAQFQALNR